MKFIFAVDGYDIDEILNELYDLDTDYADMMTAYKMMRAGEYNKALSSCNPYTKEALVVTGPVSDSSEFIDSLVHEIHHVAVAIAEELGVDLESETTAYIAGDAARELADVVCEIGCHKCHSK